MNTERILITITVSALCTFFLRALPFLAFSGAQKMPSDGFVIELLWDGSEGTANLLEDMTQLEGDYSAVQ